MEEKKGGKKGDRKIWEERERILKKVSHPCVCACIYSKSMLSVVGDQTMLFH